MADTDVKPRCVDCGDEIAEDALWIDQAPYHRKCTLASLAPAAAKAESASTPGDPADGVVAAPARPGATFTTKELEERIRWCDGLLNLYFDENLRMVRDFAAVCRALLVAQEDIQRLERWVDDSQAGMWINCVYCGHR